MRFGKLEKSAIAILMSLTMMGPLSACTKNKQNVPEQPENSVESYLDEREKLVSKIKDLLKDVDKLDEKYGDTIDELVKKAEAAIKENEELKGSNEEFQKNVDALSKEIEELKTKSEQREKVQAVKDNLHNLNNDIMVGKINADEQLAIFDDIENDIEELYEDKIISRQEYSNYVGSLVEVKKGLFYTIASLSVDELVKGGYIMELARTKLPGGVEKSSTTAVDFISGRFVSNEISSNDFLSNKISVLDGGKRMTGIVGKSYEESYDSNGISRQEFSKNLKTTFKYNISAVTNLDQLNYSAADGYSVTANIGSGGKLYENNLNYNIDDQGCLESYSLTTTNMADEKDSQSIASDYSKINSNDIDKKIEEAKLVLANIKATTNKDDEEPENA